MLIILAFVVANVSPCFSFGIPPNFYFARLATRHESLCSRKELSSTELMFRSSLDKWTMYGTSHTGERRPSSTRTDLKGLPRVYPAPELWARAVKRASYVKEDTSIKNPRNRCRKLAAERLSVLSKELTKPLGTCLDGFDSVLARLPPFETVVVDLTVRHRYKIDVN